MGSTLTWVELVVVYRQEDLKTGFLRNSSDVNDLTHIDREVVRHIFDVSPATSIHKDWGVRGAVT